MATTHIKIKVDADAISQDLQERFEAVNNPKTMLAMHNTLAKMCNPYVPFLNGPLSQTIEVSPQGVSYIQPYARRQYFGDDFNFTKDFHPLATSRWDEAMLRDHSKAFYREIKDIMEERIIKSNG